MTATPWNRKEVEGLLFQTQLMKLRTREQALSDMAPLEERLVEMLAIENWGEAEELRGLVEDFLQTVRADLLTLREERRGFHPNAMPVVRENHP
jgi:hypothetical protein